MNTLTFTFFVLCLTITSYALRRRIKTTKCRYTFIVNEVDSGHCANVLSPQQSDTFPERSLSVNRPVPLHLPSATGEQKEVNSWQTNMEKQLYQELQKTSELNSTVSKHESTLQKTEKLLAEYSSNFTAIFRMLQYLEKSVQEQNALSDNLDKKLSGVMLDVVEVNTVLSKKVIATADGDVRSKVIEVKSASQETSCSRSPDSVVYRGQYCTTSAYQLSLKLPFNDAYNYCCKHVDMYSMKHTCNNCKDIYHC